MARVAKDNTFNQARNLGVLNGSKGYSNRVSAADPVDIVRFRVRNRSNFQAALQGLSNDADLTLLNRQRRILAVSSNSDQETEVIETELNAGIYFVQVERQRGSTRYSLRLSNQAGGSSGDAGNTLATALRITPGTVPFVIADAVGTSDTDDFYRVTVDAPANLDVTLGGLNNFVGLQVLDASGTVVASSNRSNTTLRNLNLNLLPGNYFIQITASQANAAPVNYSLTATLTAPQLFGLTSNNFLVAFNPNNLNAVQIPVTGLGLTETLVDLDFRPATGQLFGLSNVGRLYTVNALTGAATIVGNSTPVNLIGTRFGIDFDPIADRLRVVSNSDQSLRLNPSTGELTNSDPFLTYAATDANSSTSPDTTRIAYGNNRPGAAATTLYAIDNSLNLLATQGSPAGTPTAANTGQLFTTGRLNTSFNNNGGFDIFTDVAGFDFAYATSNTNLFGINLATGVPTSLGSVQVNGTGVALIGLAVRP